MEVDYRMNFNFQLFRRTPTQVFCFFHTENNLSRSKSFRSKSTTQVLSYILNRSETS